MQVEKTQKRERDEQAKIRNYSYVFSYTNFTHNYLFFESARMNIEINFV